MLTEYKREVLLGKSRLTVEQYEQIVRLLERFARRGESEPLYVDELTKSFLSDFRSHRFEEEKRSPATVNKDLRHARALVQFAFDEELLHDAPRKLRPLPENLKSPKAWSVDEMSRQLAVAQALTGDVKGIPRRIFWPALLLVVYDCGGRITASMRAKASAVDLRDQTLSLAADDQKQGEEQVFRLSDQTFARLQLLLGYYRERLFPWPWDADEKWRTLRRNYRKILRSAGLPTGREDMFHRLRKTTATHFTNAADEESAQRQLGHSSVAVTRRYIDPTKITGRKQAADVLPRPVLPPIGGCQGLLFT